MIISGADSKFFVSYRCFRMDFLNVVNGVIGYFKNFVKN